MKRRNAMTIAAAVLAAAGLGTGLGLTAGPGTASAATTAAAVTRAGSSAKASGYVALGCDLKPVVKPATYTIACADAGLGIEHMHWTSWSAQLASGYGTLWENNCTPYCAAGKIIGYPVLATFWGSAAVKGHPAEHRYTRLTVIFTGKRPPVYAGPGKAAYPLTQTFTVY